MKKLISLLILLILFLFGFNSDLFAQQDIDVALGDRIALQADQYDGAIQWEVSLDNAIFTEVSGNDDGSLDFDVSLLPIYLRARIEREGCEPHYSEVVEVVENSATAAMLWSEASTWGGTKPVQGEEVTIPEGAVIMLDENPPALGGLLIEGTLVFDRKNLELSSEWIMVSGTLMVGTKAQPFEDSAIITLNDTDAEADLMGMGTRGIMVMGGRLELHGAVPEITKTKINENLEQGATSVPLVDNVDWEPDDMIIITPTDYFQAGGGWSFTQKVAISDVPNASELTISDGLNAFRWGVLQYPTTNGMSLSQENLVTPPSDEGETPLVLDERAGVALLTRNIIIEAPDDALWNDLGFGAHTMIMPGSEAHVEGVWFRRVGQRGRIRRYPFHWHMLSYAGTETLDDASGQYFNNNVVDGSENRGIVIHGTNGVTVQGNIVFDIKGHGVFLEDAVERRNVIDDNLVAYVRNPEWGDQLMLHEVGVGIGGSSGYWIANPDNIMTNNTATDCTNFGFWLAFPTQPFGNSINVLAEDGLLIRPNRLLFGVFDNNTAHSNRNDGLHLDDPQVDEQGNTLPIQYWSTTDGRTDINTNSFENLRRFALTRFKTWKNMDNGSWDRGVWTDMVEFVSADNCGRFFAGSGAEGLIERSLVVGTSLNFGMNGTGRPPTADAQFFNDASIPTAFATYHSAFNIQNNVVLEFPVDENIRSGVFATDDYYLRPVEMGMIRNQDNLLINSHPGSKLEAAHPYFTLASALWDPYGFWGPENNFLVYNTPFLTYGKSITTGNPSTEVVGGVSVPGPFYGVAAFVLNGSNSPDFDLMAIHVNRLDPENLANTVGSWDVITSQPGWALNHMRDFAVVPEGVYELTFPDNPEPSQLLFEVENMLETTDAFVMSVEFSEAVDPAVFIRQESNNNNFTVYDQVASIEELMAASSESWWQDSANNRVWLKVFGGRWIENEFEEGFEALTYEKMQVIIQPAN